MTAVGQAPASTPWTRAVREHREALDRLLSTIEGAEAEAWRRAPHPESWSPAQTAEHLVLVYEGIQRELAGAGSMRARARPWHQRLLRWFLLPHILFHQKIPLRARSPREARPSAEGLPREEAARRLTELSGPVERDLESAQELERALNHPYFGPISPLRTLRFCAVHLDHHRRQILDSLAR